MPGQFPLERLADPMRIGGKRTRDELDARTYDLVCQPVEAALRGGGELDSEGFVTHR